MEGNENILEAIYEDDNFEEDDVEMIDVEEGELVEKELQNDCEQSSVRDVHVVNKEPQNKNRRRRAKKKNKRKTSYSGSNVTDINRFVLDACRRLKERKSYMVYTAVGCLGVSALSDIIKEVDAIQACGGQRTADGKRFRTGGGILWSILRSREPNAYKEIMKKAKEFEKQFKQPNIRQAADSERDFTENIPHTFTEQESMDVPDASQQKSALPNLSERSNSEGKRVPVHDRLRVPVSYDDDLLKEEFEV